MVTAVKAISTTAETEIKFGWVPRGLCATCAHGPHCTLCSRDHRGTNVYCEEFELIEFIPSPETRRERIAVVRMQVPTRSPEDVGVAQYKGLCLNCDHSDTCALPRFLSGVWHCEEYA